jgi:hypothetical protein
MLANLFSKIPKNFFLAVSKARMFHRARKTLYQMPTLFWCVPVSALSYEHCRCSKCSFNSAACFEFKKLNLLLSPPKLVDLLEETTNISVPLQSSRLKLVHRFNCFYLLLRTRTVRTFYNFIVIKQNV